MEYSERSASLFSLIVPFSAALLVLCVTVGYWVYHFISERAYRNRWKDYDDCGLA